MDVDPLSLISMRNGGDKFGAHVYTPVYHRLLGHLRLLPIKLLEIGVGGYGDPKAGGSSLMTWGAYFPLGQIIGLDISEKDLDLPPNVTLYQGSQDDPVVLEKIVREHGPFDVIIDDGSHHVELTLRSFLLLYAGLREDGFYIVEDTQTSFYDQLAGRPDGRETMFEVAHAISLAMHQGEGYRPPSVEAVERGDGASPSIADHTALWLEYGRLTQSVSVFRNLIVFQRGDNTYPSNTKFDFAHPEVQRKYQTMELAAAISPSPRDSLARIDMNIWGGRSEEAAALARLTADRYPDDVALLHELLYMMKWAKRDPEVESIGRRIAALRQL